MLTAMAGLNHAPVFGTFIATATDVPDNLIAAMMAISIESGEGAVTRLPRCSVGALPWCVGAGGASLFRADMENHPPLPDRTRPLAAAEYGILDRDYLISHYR